MYIFYLDTVTGSVIPELTEQLGQESLRCGPGEEAGWTAGESRGPLGPAHRHYRSNTKLNNPFQSLHEVNAYFKMIHKTLVTNIQLHIGEFRVVSRAKLGLVQCRPLLLRRVDRSMVCVHNKSLCHLILFQISLSGTHMILICLT